MHPKRFGISPEYLLTLEPPLVLFIAFTDRKCVLCTFNQINQSVCTVYWRNWQINICLPFALYLHV